MDPYAGQDRDSYPTFISMGDSAEFDAAAQLWAELVSPSGVLVPAGSKNWGVCVCARALRPLNRRASARLRVSRVNSFNAVRALARRTGLWTAL